MRQMNKVFFFFLHNFAFGEKLRCAESDGWGLNWRFVRALFGGRWSAAPAAGQWERCGQTWREGVNRAAARTVGAYAGSVDRWWVNRERGGCKAVAG